MIPFRTVSVKSNLKKLKTTEELIVQTTTTIIEHALFNCRFMHVHYYINPLTQNN